MNRCEDCKYFEAGAVLLWCLRNRLPDFTDSLGTRHEGNIGTAWAARKDESLCGPRAVWFEPKYNG